MTAKGWIALVLGLLIVGCAGGIWWCTTRDHANDAKAAALHAADSTLSAQVQAHADSLARVNDSIAIANAALEQEGNAAAATAQQQVALANNAKHITDSLQHALDTVLMTPGQQITNLKATVKSQAVTIGHQDTAIVQLAIDTTKLGRRISGLQLIVHNDSTEKRELAQDRDRWKHEIDSLRAHPTPRDTTVHHFLFIPLPKAKVTMGASTGFTQCACGNGVQRGWGASEGVTVALVWGH